MTYNIHADTLFSRMLDGLNTWPQRRERVVRVLAESGCEVIGLQECVSRQWDYLAYALSDVYDGYGQGSEGGLSGELVPLLWQRARFELLASGTFWLNERLLPAAAMEGAKRNRVCSWVRLRDKSGSLEITVFNTHFDQKAGRVGDQIRLRSAQLVFEQIKTAGQRNCVLMGDLNCQPESLAVRYLSEQLVEAYNAVCNIRSCDRPSTFHVWGEHTIFHMDYVLCTPDVRPVAYEIVCSAGDSVTGQESDRWPSDHFPVRVELELGPE